MMVVVNILPTIKYWEQRNYMHYCLYFLKEYLSMVIVKKNMLSSVILPIPKKQETFSQ